MTVGATQTAWATFLTTPRERRRLPSEDIRLEGIQPEIRRFTKAVQGKARRPMIAMKRWRKRLGWLSRPSLNAGSRFLRLPWSHSSGG